MRLEAGCIIRRRCAHIICASSLRRHRSDRVISMLANLRSALAGAKPTAAAPVAALPPPAPAAAAAAAAVTSHASSNGEAAAASRAQTLTVAGFEIEGISIAGQVSERRGGRGSAPHACARPLAGAFALHAWSMGLASRGKGRRCGCGLEPPMRGPRPPMHGPRPPMHVRGGRCTFTHATIPALLSLTPLATICMRTAGDACTVFPLLNPLHPLMYWCTRETCIIVPRFKGISPRITASPRPPHAGEHHLFVPRFKASAPS